MKNLFKGMRMLALLILLSPLMGLSQTFEGTITYANTYKSKSPQLKDEQISAMMGTEQQYSIKNKDYKSVFNGSFIKMQLYKGVENRSYTLTGNSDVFYWEDYSKNKDAATKFEIEKGKETILGVVCDVITISAPKSKTTYYYNSKYGVNPELFAKHQYGNWYDILSKTKALPLKSVYEDDQFIMTSTATKITPVKLADSVFAMPEKAKTSPATW